MKTQATTQKTEITSAAIYLVTDKATGEKYYAVKSDSSDTYYQIKWDQAACEWRCNCPARKPCKHERAVIQVERIRYQEKKEASQKEASPVAVAVASEPPVKGNLNGERGFSLFR